MGVGILESARRAEGHAPCGKEHEADAVTIALCCTEPAPTAFERASALVGTKAVEGWLAALNNQGLKAGHMTSGALRKPNV